jgi:hypothetical protein
MIMRLILIDIEIHSQSIIFGQAPSPCPLGFREDLS